jgi:hypothetical protein
VRWSTSSVISTSAAGRRSGGRHVLAGRAADCKFSIHVLVPLYSEREVCV